MTVKRGEVWLADLNPTKGSEQAGIRPVIVFQNCVVSQFTTTVITIPLTTNQRRASLPTCLKPETLTSLEGIVLLTLGY